MDDAGLPAPQGTVNVMLIHLDGDPNVTVHAVYVTDPNEKVRLILTYPPSTGGNFQEIIRASTAYSLRSRTR